MTGEPTPSTVVCVGGRGGCGTSTVAGGLALALADAGRRPLLLDLDPVRGDLAGAWSVPAERSLADLEPVLDELGPSHLRRAAFPHPSGVALVAASAERGTAWTASSGARLLRAAEGEWDAVVADLGAGDGRVAAGATAAADRVLLLCPATFAGARRARLLTARLDQLGAVEDLRVVLAPAGRPAELGPRAFARAAGVPVALSLPNSPAEAREISEGRWIRGRRRRLASAIAELAGALP